MSAEAIFAINGVFEYEITKRGKSQGHIGAEKDEGANTGKILKDWQNRRCANNDVE